MKTDYGSVVSQNNDESSSLLAPRSSTTTTTTTTSSFSSFSSLSSSSSWRNTNIPILVTAFMAALASGGPTYAFGLYSQELKTSLHLTQSQMNTVSSANFCAGLLSWIPGICVDVWGSRTAMMIGGTMEAIALMVYYFATQQFAIRQTSSSITVPLLSLIGITIFMSNSLVIGALFKMMVQTTKSNNKNNNNKNGGRQQQQQQQQHASSKKGAAVGAAKGYLGLGAGVYSVLFDTLGLENNLLFLPMAAVLCIVAIVIPAAVLLPDRDTLHRHAIQEVVGSRHYRIIYMGLITLALLVLATSCKSLMENENNNSGIVDAAVSTATATATEENYHYHHPHHHHDGYHHHYHTPTTILMEPAKKNRFFFRSFLILAVWFLPIWMLFVLGRDEEGEGEEEGEGKIEMNEHNNNTNSIHDDDLEVAKSLGLSKTELLGINMHTGEYGMANNNNNNNDKNNDGNDDNDDDNDDDYSESAKLFPPSNTISSSSSSTASSSSSTSSSLLLSSLPKKSNHADDNNNNSNDVTLLHMLQTSTAWLLCWTCTIGVGSGTILTNNMGQIVESLNFSPRTASASLAFFSVAQAMARVGVGTISDAAMGWKCFSSLSFSSLSSSRHHRHDNNNENVGIPRTAFLIVSTMIGIVGHTVLASSVASTSMSWFLLGIVLSGISFGMLWPLMVLIVGEIFGTTNHGANYMFYDGFTSAVGTITISKFLASFVYESHIQTTTTSITSSASTTITANNGENQPQQFMNAIFHDTNATAEATTTTTTIAATSCYGRECFEMSHWIIVGLLITCLMTGMAVWSQTKEIYKSKQKLEATTTTTTAKTTLSTASTSTSTTLLQRIRSADEMFESPYKTWRKQDALKY